MITDNRLDIPSLAKKVWSKKGLYIKVWIVVFILACAWIFPQPRYYTCSVSLAPESTDGKSGGGLASLAASFGLNVGSMSSSDAIYPQLYPDIFESTDFVVDMFDIQVTTKDQSITTDYFTYLTKHNKPNPYLVPFLWTKNKISSLIQKKDTLVVPGKNGKRFDYFRLNAITDEVKTMVSSAIKCTYSKTTDVVTITVTDQDPLVCALLADSAMMHLQDFIINYRTKKAKNDYEYYKDLTEKAKREYDSARIEYSTFVDKHSNAHRSSYQTEQMALESEMTVKQQLYNIMTTRMEEAQAKIQENTPAFTTLKCATVPVKPAGPKRLMFVIAMLFLSTIAATGWILRKEIAEWF